MPLLCCVECAVPSRDQTGLLLEEGIGGFENLDFLDGVTLLDRIDDVLAPRYTAEDCVPPVEPRCGFMGDEELAAVGARACICHGENTGAGVAQPGVNFVGELVAGASAPSTLGVTALNHEIRDYAVETQSVVVTTLCEIEEVGNCHRGLASSEGGFDVSLVGHQDDVDVTDLLISRCRRCWRCSAGAHWPRLGRRWLVGTGIRAATTCQQDEDCGEGEELEVSHGLVFRVWAKRFEVGFGDGEGGVDVVACHGKVPHFATGAWVTFVVEM